jgi:hypothetical protein
LRTAQPGLTAPAIDGLSWKYRGAPTDSDVRPVERGDASWLVDIHYDLFEMLEDTT